MSALKFLAFDTSTDVLSLALTDGKQTWRHEGAGGAQASAQLIPQALSLLTQAGLKLSELDAIVLGRGPGSFTGLRTACAVAQGLAFGASLPVLPVDTLLAVAEQARWDWPAASQMSDGLHVLALLDARMDEVYAAAYAWQGAEKGWREVQTLRVSKPEAVCIEDLSSGPWLCAGNALAPYGDRLLQALPVGLPHQQALPTAQALLRLAPGLWHAGHAVPAHEAMPLYVRDKVAYTTDERLAMKSAQAAGV